MSLIYDIHSVYYNFRCSWEWVTDGSAVYNSSRTTTISMEYKNPSQNVVVVGMQYMEYCCSTMEGNHTLLYALQLEFMHSFIMHFHIFLYVF